MYANDAVGLNHRFMLPLILQILIEIYLSKGDVKESKLCLDQFRDQLEVVDIERYKNLYIYLKALILKSSLRARDRIKSENIFKNIALNNTNLGQLRVSAIINLCDLYLTELKITNDPEIIKETQPYIQELLDIADEQHLHLVLPESFILQAKLALLNFNVKAAKRFLIQAQNIAESKGIKRLAMKISYEHDVLMKQLNNWQNLKESEATFSERWKLAGLNEQMEHMVKKRLVGIPEVSEEKPVSIFIITEGGTPLFSHSFIEDISFESHLLGGFLTTIDYFIREMFSEGLDRAIFGEYTLLLKSIPPFFISYIFKGDSYYALQKINYFVEQIIKEDDIWQNLLKSFQINQFIHLKDIPLLESLITEIFIAKRIVFNEL